MQARAGQQYEQHAFREGPAFLASPLPSMGAMYLVPIGILAALHAREKTGRGQRVETSLYQGVLAFTTMLWVWAEHGLNDLQAMMTKKYPGSGHQAEAIMTGRRMDPDAAGYAEEGRDTAPGGRPGTPAEL